MMPADVAAQVAALPREEFRCSFHDSHDPVTQEPTGNQCPNEATHVLLWTWVQPGEPGYRRWSFGCPDHIGPPGIDPSGTHGWEFTVEELNP